MEKTAGKWFELVEPRFGFLRDLGFDRVEVYRQRKGDDPEWVQYSSKSSAIRVIKTVFPRRCSVALIRLREGEVPPYPDWMRWLKDDRIDWASLEDILLARQPDVKTKVKERLGLSVSRQKTQLLSWAQVLREVVPDFLEGSFAPIDEAAKILRSEYVKRPREIRIRAPKRASEESVMKIVELLKTNLPSDVEIKIQRRTTKRHDSRESSVAPTT